MPYRSYGAADADGRRVFVTKSEAKMVPHGHPAACWSTSTPLPPVLTVCQCQILCAGHCSTICSPISAKHTPTNTPPEPCDSPWPTFWRRLRRARARAPRVLSTWEASPYRRPCRSSTKTSPSLVRSAEPSGCRVKSKSEPVSRSAQRSPRAGHAQHSREVSHGRRMQ